MAEQYLHSNENKKRTQALLGTAIFHALLFLLFILAVFHTPIPPFPEGGSPGIEISFGTSNMGSGNVQASDIGFQSEEKQEQKTQKEITPTHESKIVTSDVDESISISEKEKEKHKKNTSSVQIPEKKKEEEKKPSNQLANALNKMKENSTTQSGGYGNSNESGQQGTPDGTPGGGWGGGTGPGIGAGSSFYSLIKGRQIIKEPEISDDSQEEGTVVVEVTIDASGKITSAIPGKRGSTTTSSVLYAKARQAALSSGCNPDNTVPEQKGYIIFDFKVSGTKK